jgi:hypothetical protein
MYSSSLSAVQVWDSRRLLVVMTDVLHRTVLSVPRAQAKAIFREIEKGGVAALVRLQLEDNTELLVQLSLDASEFVGTLRFSVFKQGLDAMLHTIAARLASKSEDLNLFTDESSGQRLFLLPGVVQDEGQTHVLVMAMSDNPQKAALTICLQYLDPAQFE